MTIQRTEAYVVKTTDLSPSAREVTLALKEPISFKAGAFVNVFFDGRRRAYSISSDSQVANEITLSIRKGNPEGVSVHFWDTDIEGHMLSVMGPLGVNTVDAIEHKRVFLIGFGIGVSVIKALTHELLRDETLQELYVITGSRNESEMLYKEFFDSLHDRRLHTRFVLSKPQDERYPYKGRVQEHLEAYDFSNATVYLCGQEEACEEVKTTIEARSPKYTQFLIESFDP